MRRTLPKALALAGTAALALSLTVTAATAAPGKAKQYGKLAAKQCAQERKALGSADFAALHGTPAMPNCMGVVRGEAAEAASNAAKECRDEGVSPGKGNAFGKCVSGKVRSAVAEDRAERVNAAQACRTEREDPGFAAAHGGVSFDEFYGTNANNRNAFGKCVSAKAKTQEPPTTPTTPPTQ